ncbi:MAG: NADH-quinone oxidoreductase subunit F [Propionibacteriaceae bacterium]|nr:NADH-quinone oxidoreductase subunit F [Propionibacteriaceae bacterium]
MSARVEEGPRLLAHLADGPGLARHRLRHPAPTDVTVERLAAAAATADLRGRGGAGFPFATKLRTAARRGAVVVVNLSEGEPASHKDEALAMLRPHLILDGAVLAARALRAHRIHLVLPGDKPLVGTRMSAAIAEREDSDRVQWRTHTAGVGFVSGQARAVIELISGRANLPVTAWTPEAVSGYRGRPTLLSNAETFAQLGSVWSHGPDPATMLITRAGNTSNATVMEVALGAPWSGVLSPAELDRPVLLGGYHGVWVPGGALRGRRIDSEDLAGLGARLGAGVVLPLAPGSCPVHETARIVSYLASESAQGCGPCRLGLPTLALAVADADRGVGSVERIEELTGVLSGRGACAHPDGTVRLVASLQRWFRDELRLHQRQECNHGALAPAS